MQSFSPYHNYSLGTDLRDAGRRALKLVVGANARHDKQLFFSICARNSKS